MSPIEAPNALSDILLAVIQPAVAALSFELWGLECLPSGRNNFLLRIYIDHEQGITVDHCEAVSRQVSAVLDVETAVSDRLGNYILEVSSPGLERVFFYPSQYVNYCGELFNIKLNTRFEIKNSETSTSVFHRRILGRLQAVQMDKNNEPEALVLMIKNQNQNQNQTQSIILPIGMIQKAHLVSEVISETLTNGRKSNKNIKNKNIKNKNIKNKKLASKGNEPS